MLIFLSRKKTCECGWNSITPLFLLSILKLGYDYSSRLNRLILPKLRNCSGPYVHLLQAISKLNKKKVALISMASIPPQLFPLDFSCKCLSFMTFHEVATPCYCSGLKGHFPNFEPIPNRNSTCTLIIYLERFFI